MKSIRMCIACRNKIEQKKLIRLQCINKDIVYFTGKGRSFYICKKCIMKNNKNLIKPLNKFCKKNNSSILKIIEKLKEKIFNG